MTTGAREKNLKPVSGRTKSERTALGRKGAAVRTENAKKRKLLKDLARAFLDCPADRATREAIAKVYPDFVEGDVTNGLAEIVSLHRRIMTKGDPRAFEVLRDTAGEKPRDEVELTGRDGGPIAIAPPDPATAMVALLKGIVEQEG